MKLKHYLLRNLSVPLLVILAVWAFVFYLLILYEVNDETNDTLRNYKNIIIKEVLADSTKLHNHLDIMSRYYIKEIPANEANLSKDEFFDSVTYIEVEDEFEPIRVLKTNFKGNNNKYYELIIELSTLEKDDLIETIYWSVGLLYGMLIFCILLVIHLGFHQSFRPLYVILNWLEKYHPDKENESLNNDTKVEEFKILNHAIQDFTNRNTRLYNQQKQFVENAAHELQTPLAVSLNKLELLSESPDCTEEQLNDITGIHRQIKNLIKINKSLLLLSRIENHQFPEMTDINLNKLILLLNENYAEIYGYKNISVSIKENESINIQMNESLATTLFSNLIKNGYIHNIQGGKIDITISDKTLIIENTGQSQPLDKEQLFTRFSKQTKKIHSSGLGLAIVKSILLIYNFNIVYSYNELHRFTLRF